MPRNDEDEITGNLVDPELEQFCCRSVLRSPSRLHPQNQFAYPHIVPEFRQYEQMGLSNISGYGSGATENTYCVESFSPVIVRLYILVTDKSLSHQPK